MDRKILTYWATLRSTASTDAKAKELAKALRACDEEELADLTITLTESNGIYDLAILKAYALIISTSNTLEMFPDVSKYKASKEEEEDDD